MKYLTLRKLSALAAGMLLLGSTAAHALTIAFSNVEGANISFSAATDNFTFNDSTLAGPGHGRDFAVTGSSGVGDSVGLFGNIGGTFHIGAITINGAQQTAPVTTVGPTPATFSISDGTHTLTSDISWISIFTAGTSGGLNAGGSLNLSNVVYTGTNADLVALSVATDRTASISFTFIPARSLTQLTTGSATRRTSYDGAVNGNAPPRVPDGGSVLAMLGCTLLGMQGFRRWFKSRRA